MNTLHFSPADLMRTYRVGSGDWSWAREAWLLWTSEPIYMLKLAESIHRQGVRWPVMLGPDGRIWDGHHRIILARMLGIRRIPATHS